MATINYSLAAGSTTTPYYFGVKITKQLCAKTAHTPVFAPAFRVLGFRNVGTNQYEVLVNAQGIVTFTPCKSCCGKTQEVNENFVISVYSTAAPTTITATAGIPTNSVIPNGTCCKCCNCGNILVCDVPLTLTVA